MDKSPSITNGNGSTDASRYAESPHPTLSRESTTSTATITPKTESQPSRLISQSSQTSTTSSAAPSPLQSREPSPTRPLARTNTSRSSSAKPGTRSRKNSLQDLSPSRHQSRTSIPAPSTSSRTLSSSTTPTLLPATTDLIIKAPVPIKSPTNTEHLRESPRWPVSPRLRSPPPTLNKPNLAPPRRGEQDAPAIAIQRATPSPQPPVAPEVQSDTDTDDALLQPGMRTPARVAGGSTSTLETVEEASPISSPRVPEEFEEKSLEDSIISFETSSQPETSDVPVAKSIAGKANLIMNESGSESGSVKAGRRPGATSAPPLTTRQSSASTKGLVSKGKAGEVSLQSMTVETETVTSIPQMALAPGVGAPGANGSLRTKPSSETIRPKKEKKKTTRKQSAVTSGTASSKADIFEAKVASAVEEANSSDSEETFVYDSNPPDGRDRPHRFHSRTPSATSMASQVDRNGMRSIHSVMEGVGPTAAVKKNMKFVNSYNSTSNENAVGDDDGRGTGRSNAGSARGTARHHHHFGRWGRNGGNGHPSLFAEESPFTRSYNSRQSSGPPSPRFNSGRGASTNGRRGTHLTPGYDLDDTTGADDETTPLIQSGTIRSARSVRSRRMPVSLRSLEQQSYRSPPSVLNRFASCLVLTVMLLLVVSGAIGFMFATSQPLTDVELISIKNVVASEQELLLDITIKAHNPNVVVVVVDSAQLSVFAQSPHAGTDSEWWRHPKDSGTFAARRKTEQGTVHAEDDSIIDPPVDDSAPLMRLGVINEFASTLSFEGSFFHQGISVSTAEIKLEQPGNGTAGGTERWERILEDKFDLVIQGVLQYTLPLSQRVMTALIEGRTTVKPDSKDPSLRPPNDTDVSISW